VQYLSDRFVAARAGFCSGRPPARAQTDSVRLFADRSSRRCEAGDKIPTAITLAAVHLRRSFPAPRNFMAGDELMTVREPSSCCRNAKSASLLAGESRAMAFLRLWST